MANQGLEQCAQNILRKNRFEHIDRLNRNEQDRAIESFTREKFQREDIGGLIEAIEVGTAASISKKPYGAKILHETFTYLLAVGEPILKSITPVDAVEKGQGNYHISNLRKRISNFHEMRDMMSNVRRGEIFPEEMIMLLDFVNLVESKQAYIESDFQIKFKWIWCITLIQLQARIGLEVRGLSDMKAQNRMRRF